MAIPLRILANIGLRVLCVNANTFFTRALWIRTNHDNLLIDFNLDNRIINEENEHFVAAVTTITKLHNHAVDCAHAYSMGALAIELINTFGWPI